MKKYETEFKLKVVKSFLAGSGFRRRPARGLTRPGCPRAALGAGAAPPNLLPFRGRNSGGWGHQRASAAPGAFRRSA